MQPVPSATQRRQAILDMLEGTGTLVKIPRMCETFGVSEVTIRRDLEILESENRIKRVRGGASLETTPMFETVFSDKMSHNQTAKHMIAACAAELVEDGQVVMLSAGSTTTFIARQLKKKRTLTVVTTAVNIASELAGLEHITLIVIGGIVRAGSYAMVGYMADHALQSYNADVAFVGVDGVDVHAGFTTPNPMEAHTDRVMLQRAATKIVVADSSKLKRAALTPIAKIGEVNYLITDSSAAEDYIEKLEAEGVNVIMGRQKMD